MAFYRLGKKPSQRAELVDSLTISLYPLVLWYISSYCLRYLLCGVCWIIVPQTIIRELSLSKSYNVQEIVSGMGLSQRYSGNILDWGVVLTIILEQWWEGEWETIWWRLWCKILSGTSFSLISFKDTTQDIFHFFCSCDKYLKYIKL